jgi:hypothetical protein
MPFDINAGTRLGLNQQVHAIREALLLADDPTLPPVLENAVNVLAAIDAEARHVQTTDLVNQLVLAANTDELEKAITTGTTEWARRSFLAAVTTSNMTSIGTTNRLAVAVAQALPDITRRLAPAFTNAVTNLTAAARQLPDGDAATNPAELLAADAGAPHRIADHAAATLIRIAQIHAPVLHTDGSNPPHVAPVAAIVNIPDDVEVESHADGIGLINSPEAMTVITEVRELVNAYGNNPALALIDLARDRWPHLTFNLATTAVTAQHRVDAVRNAGLRRSKVRLG